MSVATFLLWISAGGALGEETPERRLEQIVLRYDTVFIGEVRSVSVAAGGAKELSRRRWAVKIRVDELIQGEELPTEIVLYVHSPAQEFGSIRRLDDLSGRRCVWALRRKGTEILEEQAPFPRQDFSERDLSLLRSIAARRAEQERRRQDPRSKAGARPQARPSPPSNALQLRTEDVCMIREALARRIRKWDNPDASWLLRETERASCFIDFEGTPRIGLWVCSQQSSVDGALQFIWRRAGTYGPAFSARAVRSGSGWTVTSLDHFFIHPPPAR